MVQWLALAYAIAAPQSSGVLICCPSRQTPGW